MRARLDSNFMCSGPAPSGAAISNTRSAGPSDAPELTFGDRQAKPRDAVAIDASRQCGMAMPPGRPVGDWDSCARAAALSASTSGRAAICCEPVGQCVDDRIFGGAQIRVERDQLRADDRRCGTDRIIGGT
jgi:hypothetical protein